VSYSNLSKLVNLDYWDQRIKFKVSNFNEEIPIKWAVVVQLL